MSAARTKAHSYARHLLARGAYRDAIRVLEQTVELHGPYVGLLTDLAEAALRLGDAPALHRHVRRLESEFQAARPLLCESTRARTLLSLEKYLRELAAA